MIIQYETTPPYKKGTILHMGALERLKVTKVHKNGLRKKILSFLGCKPLVNCIEVIPI
jgi:hypothetical protein